MYRRALLQFCAIGMSSPLVGCLDGSHDGIENTSGEQQQTRTESLSATRSEIGNPTLQITNIDADSSPELTVSPEVVGSRETATTTSPASLIVRWKNVGNDPIEVGEARRILFSSVRSDDGQAVLLSPSLAETGVEFDGCWYGTDNIRFHARYDTVQLEPGEAHEGIVELYAHSDECFEGGEYRFETGIDVAEPGGLPNQEPPTYWGFTLDVVTDV